jgi:hypothetical protein
LWARRLSEGPTRPSSRQLLDALRVEQVCQWRTFALSSQTPLW